MYIDISGSSYLYLLESNGLYKIGFSQNPWTRLRRLQTGSPCPIRLVHTLQSPWCVELEETLHGRFHAKRIHGEWFALDESDVAYICTLDFRGFTPEKVAECQEAQRKRDAQTPEERAAIARTFNHVFEDATDSIVGFFSEMAQRASDRKQIAIVTPESL